MKKNGHPFFISTDKFVAENRQRDLEVIPVKSTIPVHLPLRKIKKGYFQNVRKSREVFFDKGFISPDLNIGVRPNPGSFRSFKIADNGDLIYDVRYTIDFHRRRFTATSASKKRVHNLLFLGCSYTFGEGLEDFETVSSQVSMNTRDYNVFNYGFGSWGPGNVSRLVHSQKFGDDIKFKKKDLAIYTYIDHHVDRLIGSLDIYKHGFEWANRLPYFYLDSNDRLRSSGTIKSSQPIKYIFYSILSMSSLLDFFGVQLPIYISDSDMKLVASVFDDIRVTLNDHFNETELIILFYPGSKPSQYFISLLDRLNIRTLNYSKISLDEYVNGPTSLLDGHPSAAVNQFLARQIISDLDLI